MKLVAYVKKSTFSKVFVSQIHKRCSARNISIHLKLLYRSQRCQNHHQKTLAYYTPKKLKMSVCCKIRDDLSITRLTEWPAAAYIRIFEVIHRDAVCVSRGRPSIVL